MSGIILNNKQIDELVKNGIIQINPDYESSKLQIAQYPLFPNTVWIIDKNHKIVEVFKFDKGNQVFRLKPKTYYLVDVNENIKLPKGIIGRFITSSNFIESGISITSGKIEYPYGQNNEKIRFGIYNCLDIETTISINDRIAYIQFFDLRGEELIDYERTDYDINNYNKRIHYDSDGPNYELENNEE